MNRTDSFRYFLIRLYSHTVSVFSLSATTTAPANEIKVDLEILDSGEGSDERFWQAHEISEYGNRSVPSQRRKACHNVHQHQGEVDGQYDFHSAPGHGKFCKPVQGISGQRADGKFE